ncbi:PHP domain-containing protein [Kineococcus sp. SYSU DK005]|uniref:PHP domain-containing protein n=1 Tax=Kineococcus sp. SYSU DK005 TaxID=3383126 RepID=UPI003D7C8B47
MSFAHLHVASSYSYHYGTASPADLVAAALADGADAAALTDRDGMHGLIQHVGACRAAGIDAIAGVDFALVEEPDSAAAPAHEPASGVSDALAVHRAGALAGARRHASPSRLVVLAHGRTGGAGWAALCHLTTAAHGTGARTARSADAQELTVPVTRPMPAITRAQLARALSTPRPVPRAGSASSAATAEEDHDRAGGSRAEEGCAPTVAEEAVLSVLLGADTDVGRALANGRTRLARAAWARWCSLLPAGVAPASVLAAEIVCHLTVQGHPRSISVAARALRTAAEAGIPVVLTNAVRLLHPGETISADLGDAVAALRALEDLHAPRRTGTRARTSPPVAAGAHLPGTSTSAPSSSAPSSSAPSSSALTASAGDPFGGHLRGSLLSPNAQAWLKPTAAMQRIAGEVAAAADLGAHGVRMLLSGTAAVVDRCRLDPEADLGWGTPRTPEVAVLKVANSAMGELAQRCTAGLEHRHAGASTARRQRVVDQVAAELAVIDALGYATFFLAVHETVRLVRGMGVRAAARGSAAGSVVAWLLGISGVDPLEHGLLFERFISERRESLPDIDLDVESARRHDVYRAIARRFGAQRVALMAMTQAYRSRGAVRDAGMALGVDEELIDDVAKSLRGVSARGLRAALAERPELRELAQLVRADRQLDLLVDASAFLDRLPRHTSLHPCGIILSDASLAARTPVQPCGIEGLAMSLFDKDDMDPMGWLKLDVLGVRMQSAIAHTLREIERTTPPPSEPTTEAGGDSGSEPHGCSAAAPREAVPHPRRSTPPKAHRPAVTTEPATPTRAAPQPAAPESALLHAGGAPDLDRVPLDDPATFELIRSTHTLGVFQVESPGQRELLGKFQPATFTHLVIDVALFRPGPMANDMITPFLEGHHGWRQVRLPHADLASILGETHGVAIFHEQVMRILDVFTGCGLARADVLRRHLSDAAERAEVERFFRTAAAARGYAPEAVQAVWAIVAGHGGFGFARAHAAAFAATTYHSAWLKAHHPAQFLAGLLEHDPGMYPRRLLLAEARRLRVPLLPLDVQRSTGSWRCEVLPDGRTGIRAALSQVHGIHEKEVQRLAGAQPFTDLHDLIERARPHAPTLRRLAAVGALDTLVGVGTHRSGTGRVLSRGDLLAHLNATRPRRHSTPADPGNNSARRSAHGRPPGTSGPGAGGAPAATGQAAVPVQLILPIDDAGHLLPAPSAPATASTTGWSTDDEPGSPDGRAASGHRRMQQVRTELEVMGLDLSEHVLGAHLPRLAGWGVVPAEQLLTQRTDTDVLVAGVRVATQSPPTRSGRAALFLTLDDGTGCADVTVFADVQATTSHRVLLRSSLLLVRGRLRRTGPRGVSITALQLWDLQALLTSGRAPSW